MLLFRPGKFRGEGEVGVSLGDRCWRLSGRVRFECLHSPQISGGVVDDGSPADLTQEHDFRRYAIGPFDFLTSPAVLLKEVRLADALPPSTNFAAVRQVQTGT